MPSKLALTLSRLMDSCRDAGKLTKCPPAQMPGSLTERPCRLCLGCSRWAQAAKNADCDFVWVGGIEGKCLPGLNRRASLTWSPCGGLEKGIGLGTGCLLMAALCSLLKRMASALAHRSLVDPFMVISTCTR